MYISNDNAPSSRAASPSQPSSSSSIAVYALLAVTVLFVIGGFFLVPFVRRHKPSLLQNYSCLRGKGKGVKGRLGLTGVELLPTSIKSIPTQTHIGVFYDSSNVGKDRDTRSLLSRSSSLDILPTFVAQPPTAFPIRSPRNPFKFSMFNNKSKSRYPNRRSKSLSVPRQLTVFSSSSQLSTSSPPTPSPQTHLIDFSTSDSSSSSTGVSVSSQDTSFSRATTSSDVGTHKFSPDAVVGPLIPIPMPVPSPKRPSSASHIWHYDFEEDDDQDPLMAAFKRSQAHSSSSPLPTPALLPSSNVYPQPPTPSTAGFPLTPPPPGLSFGRLDMNVAWSNKDKDRDISSPISPSPTDGIELISITPPLPSHIGPVARDLTSAPVFPPPFPVLKWDEERKDEEVKLVDIDEEEQQSESAMAFIGRKTFVDANEEPLVGVGGVHKDDEGVVDQEKAVLDGVHLAPDVDVAHEEEPVQQQVEHDEVEDDTFMAGPKNWQGWNTEKPTHNDMDDNESEEEASLSPISSHSLSPSPASSPSPSPQYSPPLGLLHASPLSIPGTNLVEISRSPSPLDVGGSFPVVSVVPPSPHQSWSWNNAATVDAAEDAWDFGTRAGIGLERVEEVSVTDVRDGEDLIRFDGSGSDGVREVVEDAGEDRPRENIDVEPVATGAIDTEEEEAWFAGEPTVVCNDMSDVVEDHEARKEAAGMHVEKKVQVMEPVFKEKLVFEVENVQPVKSDLASEPLVEMESLTLQSDNLAQDLHQCDTQEDNDRNDSHDVHDILPTTPGLDPLSTPIINTIQKAEEEFPGLDFLPLSIPLSTEKPSTIKTAQMPTPPASPPTSPLHLDARSDFSGLTTPSPSELASPFISDIPLAISGAPSPSSATSTAAARPAWSLRAADAPALGLPAPSANVGVRPRSSPDMKAKMKELDDVTENKKAVDKDSITVKGGDSDKDKKANNLHLLPSPIKLSTSLPGTFPSPEPTTEPLPSSLSSSSTAVSLSVAHSTTSAVTTDTQRLTPAPRRHTPRSPLDIALAMQLRPGLGLGADPAWMVRFLMSMFGWFAILISGRGDFDTYMYTGSA